MKCIEWKSAFIHVMHEALIKNFCYISLFFKGIIEKMIKIWWKSHCLTVCYIYAHPVPLTTFGSIFADHVPSSILFRRRLYFCRHYPPLLLTSTSNFPWKVMKNVKKYHFFQTTLTIKTSLKSWIKFAKKIDISSLVLERCTHYLQNCETSIFNKFWTR